ncbi:MAG: hypothetical protein HY293_11570 [Planctomycetes bacterium]|nr:hypothetical protein [Planctomycetota bacterium]
MSLERELETVDAALRSPLHDLAPALARWGEGLMELEVRPDEGFMKRAPYRWRFFLPKRLMKADAFEVIDRQVRELLACRDRSYLEVLDRLNLWWTEVEESKNPILHGHAFFGHDEGWVELDRKAKVRLLRVAARYRVRGEFLTLEDPFGGEVLHADSENRMKFWSRGMDGRDDGGSSRSDGRWKNSGSLGDPRVAQPPGDIVIQVERRAE